MLIVITPTGVRPAAFELCQRMMARQTYSSKFLWVVVDDGESPSQVTIDRDNITVEIVRPKPFWNEGENTQGRNLIAGLNFVGRDDIVTIWEDDDWYHPDWLSWVVDHADEAELIGEAAAIYYNVASRKWRRLMNTEHASLRCSAMRGGAIETFRKVLETPYRYYDQRLWAAHDDKKVFDRRLTVGIKAMPGRPGIALGHDGIRGNPDPEMKKLRELIGDDADWYLPYKEESAMSQREFVVVRPFRYNKRDWKVGDRFEAAKRIDLELHLHAKKVEVRMVKARPVETKNRALKVESQEAKLADDTIVKSVESEEDNEAEAVDDEADKPGRFGRRRGRPSRSSKDD